MFQLYVYAFSVYQGFKYLYITEVDPGGSHPARTLPKIGEKNNNWRKIVIFHTKYPKYFRASLRSDPHLYKMLKLGNVCRYCLWE